MTIALRAAGTATSATAAVTAVNPAVPSGAVVGDLSVLSVYAKPYNTTLTTPSGWTKIGEATNGTTGSGTDSGSTIIFMYVKEDAAVGSIGNLSQTNANTMGAVINVYSKTKSTWDYSQFTSGGDTSDGANYSATGAAGIGVASGDWVLSSTAINGDVGTVSGFDIAGMSGATIGTDVQRTNAAVTTGNDCRGLIGDTPITAGSSSSAPTMAYTNASSTSGTTMFLRLRETNVSNVVRYKFTTGSDGDAITAGNTNSTGVVVTSGTAVIDDDLVYSPTRSVLADATSTSGGNYWSLSTAQVDIVAADIYVYFNTLPNAELAIIGLFNGTTRVGTINVESAGKMRLRDAGASGGTNIWTSTAAMTTGQWYRCSIYVEIGAGTGKARAAFYASNTSTALDDSTLLTSQAMGALPVNIIRWGIKAGTQTSVSNANLDDYAYDLGATDLIAPEPFIVDLGSNSIASAEAFGTVTANVVIDVTFTGISSAEAFGTPEVTVAGYTVNPDPISSAEAFGSPTISGLLTVTPNAIGSAEAFGTAVISGLLLVSNAGDIASAETFPSPTITQVLTVTPTAIGSAEAFGSPTISGILNVTPDAISTAEAFGTAVITGLLTVVPDGIASAEAFGTPVVQVGTDVQPAGITSAEAFGTVFMTYDQTSSPSSIASAESFGSPTITTLLTVSPGGIGSIEAFGTPTINTFLEVTFNGLASHETVNAPIISNLLTVTFIGIASAEAFGTTTFIPGELLVMPPRIETQEAFGVVEITGGNQNVGTDSITTGEIFGNPLVHVAIPYPPTDDNPFSVVDVHMHPFSIKEFRIDESLA